MAEKELVKQEAPFMVLDEETGKLREINPEMRQKAMALDASIEEDIVGLAFKLFVMRSQKLYLALGYGSWTAYVAAKHMSLRQARYLLAIGQKFGKYMLEDGKNSEQNSEQKGNPGSPFEGLGFRKLRALASLPDGEFQQLMESGYVETDDGRRLSWEDIQDMVATQVEREIGKVKRKYQERISQVSSKAIQLEEEVKKLKKERDTYAERVQRLRVLEEKYGPGAVRLEEKLNYLREAYRNFQNFLQYLGKANVTEEDPEEVVVEVQRIFDVWETHRDLLRQQYGRIIIAVLSRNVVADNLDDLAKLKG